MQYILPLNAIALLIAFVALPWITLENATGFQFLATSLIPPSPAFSFLLWGIPAAAVLTLAGAILRPTKWHSRGVIAFCLLAIIGMLAFYSNFNVSGEGLPLQNLFPPLPGFWINAGILIALDILTLWRARARQVPEPNPV
jgi:hypothetical protein